jgi:5-oxoprolinase (ATP-hydrolysing)
MMDILTVAAGSGSICTFRGGRFQVGTENTGADLGPDCYRRGGPLTVTGCSAMLGKLSPNHFPAVFGLGDEQPLDQAAVAARFDTLIEMAKQEAGQSPVKLKTSRMVSCALPWTTWRLRLARFQSRGAMTSPVSRFSILAVRAVSIPVWLLMSWTCSRCLFTPNAGVLSVFGVGLAEIKALREVQPNAPLSDINAAQTAL